MTRRLMAFAGVGAMGFVLQIGAVALLANRARWPVPLATAAGVEAAVLHNFVWHVWWTWRDRQRTDLLRPLGRFHLANGLASIAGNVVIVAILTRVGVGAVSANVIAVAVMSAVNYLMADRWVFAAATIPSAGFGGIRPQAELRCAAFHRTPDAAPVAVNAARPDAPRPRRPRVRF